MLAEDELVCPQCGNLRSVCSTVEGWYPQRSMCYASGAQEATMRKLRERHKDHPEQMDGMTVWMSEADLTPDDNFV